MNYYAVHRTNPDNDLTHWKYIKKVKTSGGNWRYVYDESKDKRYENSGEHRYTTYENYRGKTNKKSNVDIYMDRKGFASTTSSKASKPMKTKDGSVYKSTTITVYSRGALERVAAKGEKFIYDRVLTKVNKRKAKKAVPAPRYKTGTK